MELDSAAALEAPQSLPESGGRGLRSRGQATSDNQTFMLFVFLVEAERIGAVQWRHLTL